MIKKQRSREGQPILRTKKWMKMGLSMVLALSISCVQGMSGKIGTVLAADYSDSLLFELDSADICQAVRLAIEDGSPLEKDAIDFTNGKIKSYRNLFYDAEDGSSGLVYLDNSESESDIYEFYPEYEASMEAEVRTFIRLPYGADTDYELTGSEEIILMYINNSDESLRMGISVDGHKCKAVTVKSYEEAFGEDEINVVTPVIPQETLEPAETVDTETTEAESGAPGEETVSTEPDATEADSTEDGQETEESQDEIETKSGSESDESQDELKPDNEENTEENQGDSKTDNTQEDKDERNEPELEGEKDFDRGDEAEQNDGEAGEVIPGEMEAKAAITRHKVPVVAAPEQSSQVLEQGDNEAAQQPVQKEEAETIAETKETMEPVNRGEETSEAWNETETAAETGDETEDAAETGSENETAAETESTAEDVAETGSEEDTEAGDGSEMDETAASESENNPAVEPSSEAETESELATDSQAGEAANDKEESVRDIAKGKYPLVGIDFCYSAKAYVTTLSDMHVDITAESQGFFWEQEMDDGITVTLAADSVASAVLTGDTVAEITTVDDSVKSVLSQSTGTAVDKLLAYDISLYDENGILINSSEWDGHVSVTFSGNKVEEITAQAETVDILHIPTDQDLSNPENIQIDLLNSVDVNGEEGIQKVSGAADSFSIIALSLGTHEDGVGPFYAGNNGLSDIYVEENDKRYTVYCHNHNKATPNGNHGGEGYYRYSYEQAIKRGYLDSADTASWNKNQAINVLLAGYPFDARGLQELNSISNQKAQMYTQQAFWSVCDSSSYSRGDLLAMAENNGGASLVKYVEGLLAASDDTSDYSQTPRLVIIGAVKNDNGFTVDFEPAGNVYRTGLMKAAGRFGGEFSFVNIPAQIQILDKHGNQIDKNQKLEVNSEFMLQTAEIVTEDMEFTFTIEYNYQVPDLYYYYTNDTISGKKCQDLIRAYLTDETGTVYLTTILRPGETPTPPEPTPTPPEPTPTPPEPTPTPPEPTPNPSPVEPGGNGGSGGGSSDSENRHAVRPDTGGPGGAVEIGPEDVPLASLPSSPTEDITILDDEVPLAALPKTGNGLSKSFLTFMVSGFLLAVYELTSRRKKQS